MHAAQIQPAWKNEPAEPAGVMVGSDAQQEWLLPWWYECYHSYNRYPIEFADFGMTEEGRQFCATRGRLIEVRDLPFKMAWYAKPFAILETKFEHCLWLDNDCEARGSLELLFSFAKQCFTSGAEQDMTLSRDPYGGPQFARGLYDDEIRYTSAPIISRHGNPLGPLWARYCLIMSDYCLGDQHALCRAIYLNQGETRIGEFPKGYIQLRLGGEPGDALVMHWTGPAGKSIIKRKIAEAGRLPVQADAAMEEIL